MASKLWVHEPDTFFLEAAREISEKWNFFVNRSVPENFQWENFSGQVPTESLRTQDSEYVYERWVQQIFDPVLVARSWVSATKWGPLAKLLAVDKNKHGHNFQNIGSKLNQRGLIDYEPNADSIWKRYFENCGRINFFKRFILVFFFGK